MKAFCKNVKCVTAAVLVFLLQMCFCDKLETNSVYYGLANIASRKQEPSLCAKELSSIKRGIDDRDRWALKLMDASGSPSTGLYWGNTYWLGSRKQCLAATSTKRVPVSRTFGPYTDETPDSIPPFDVHYYAAYFTHNSTLQVFVHWDNEILITLGLCLPTSCNEFEVFDMLDEYFDSGVLRHQHLYNMTLKMGAVKKTEDDFSWMKTKIFKTFAVFLVTVLGLTTIGTIYDLNTKSDESTPQRANDNVVPKKQKKSLFTRVIICFSIPANSKNLFDTTLKEDGMPSIFGIRTLTICWIVLNHGVLYVADFFYNRTSAYYVSDLMILQAFSNSSFSVDTFFCISGFLLAYGFMDLERKKKNAGKIESLEKKMTLIVYGTIHRFLRLVPSYMTALGFAYIATAARNNQTAFWTVERNDINCEKYWWRNLLFINNLYPKAEMCMTWSWYLSSDMQNCILGMLLLVLATSYLKQTIYAVVGIFVAANAYTAYASYSIGFVPFIDNIWSYYDVVYSRPWTRIGPNFIGLAAGCIFSHYKRRLPLSKGKIALCWLIGLGSGSAMMFGFADKDMSLFASTLYMGFSRSIWALSVSWLMLACLTGNGGFVNSFLSLKMWIPLGRVSYCVYLINPMVIRTFSSYTDSTWEVGVATAIVNGLGFVMLSFLIGFVFTLLFESPFFRLIKLVMGDADLKPKADQGLNVNKTEIKKEL